MVDPPPKRVPGLFSFRAGLGQLSQALASHLGERCVLGCPVQALVWDDQGFRVDTARGSFGCAQLVLATPPAEAAEILASLDPTLARELSGVPLAPIATVHLGFQHRAEAIPEGFGFLAPRNEGLRSLGVLFPSRLFAGRAPEGGDLLCGYVGGATDPEALGLSDEALARIVLEDLKTLVNLTAKPDLVRVVRHARAIPQFALGHLARMARVRAGLARWPGLFLAGNYLKGVGMKDAIESGLEAAQAVRSALDRGRQAA